MEMKIAENSPSTSLLNKLYMKNTYNTMNRNYSRCVYLKEPSLQASDELFNFELLIKIKNSNNLDVCCDEYDRFFFA